MKFKAEKKANREAASFGLTLGLGISPKILKITLLNIKKIFATWLCKKNFIKIFLDILIDQS